MIHVLPYSTVRTDCLLSMAHEMGEKRSLSAAFDETKSCFRRNMKREPIEFACIYRRMQGTSSLLWSTVFWIEFCQSSLRCVSSFIPTENGPCPQAYVHTGTQYNNTVRTWHGTVPVRTVLSYLSGTSHPTLQKMCSLKWCSILIQTRFSRRNIYLNVCFTRIALNWCILESNRSNNTKNLHLQQRTSSIKFQLRSILYRF